jgi:hypothetical protein
VMKKELIRLQTRSLALTLRTRIIEILIIA